MTLPNAVTFAVILLPLFTTGETRAQVQTGFAVNVGVGLSRVNDRDGADTFNANDFGLMFGAEYQFSDRFALGLGAFQLGSPEDDFNGVPTTIEVRGVDLAMRFIMPVSDEVDVFALLGRVQYAADVEPGGGTGLFGESATEVGLGLDIGTSESFAFRLVGRYFDGPRDERGALVTVGFSYRF